MLTCMRADIEALSALNERTMLMEYLLSRLLLLFIRAELVGLIREEYFSIELGFERLAMGCSLFGVAILVGEKVVG